MFDDRLVLPFCCQTSLASHLQPQQPVSLYLLLAFLHRQDSYSIVNHFFKTRTGHPQCIAVAINLME